MNNKFTIIKNNEEPVLLKDIPVLKYPDFFKQTIEFLNEETNHCVIYYAIPLKGKLKFICCIGSDVTGDIYVFSHELDYESNAELLSITKHHSAMHCFEREIHENFGVVFTNHPWLKPVRYPFNSADKAKNMGAYPFYGIEGDELHEVGVGPVHAGIIEPGHFRFICSGEQILHLEIQLGYQHRGIENLFASKKSILQKTILSENIAGDTSIGHALAFVGLLESLAGLNTAPALSIERCIALELERIAAHIGGLSGLCTDIAYQPGNAVFGALRTPVINFTQLWCGNRLGKGLIRVGGANYTLDNALSNHLNELLDDFESKFMEMADLTFSNPGVLGRFEQTGRVTKKQVKEIGAVGMTARSAGLLRDVRFSHPFQYFKKFQTRPVILEQGDVLARAMIRKREIESSLSSIRAWINLYKEAGNHKNITKPVPNAKLKSEAFIISLTEGWRGEICHAAVTGESGNICHYKIKDPSLHNWTALALAVRNQEISDFPVCNKSFDLSYCGHDL